MSPGLGKRPVEFQGSPLPFSSTLPFPTVFEPLGEVLSSFHSADSSTKWLCHAETHPTCRLCRFLDDGI